MLRLIVATCVAGILTVGSVAAAAEIPFTAGLSVSSSEPASPSVVTPLVMDPAFDPSVGTLTAVSFTISFVGGVHFTFPAAGPYALSTSVEAALLSAGGDVLDTIVLPIEAVDTTIEEPRSSSLADSRFLRFTTSDVSTILSGEPLSLHVTVDMVQYVGPPVEDVTYHFRLGASEQNGRYVHSPAVPEPAAALLYASGVAVVASARRRRRAPAALESQRELPPRHGSF